MKAFYLSIFLVLITLLGYSQEICSSNFAADFMNINALNARINAKGDMFYQPEENLGLQLFDATDSTYLLTMIQAGLVLGALDESGEPRINWRGYGYDGEDTDNVTGYLGTDVDSLNCARWNKIWRVSGADIRAHLLEIQLHGTPLIRRPALYDYPATGNPYFTDYNGFILPDDSRLAPFYDANSDARYNPDDGDYPLPSEVHPAAVPDLLLWSVYNDVGFAERVIVLGSGLGVEIQQTTFAYQCSQNTLLNQTLFTQHKVINKSGKRLDSLFVGNRVDPEMGNFWDDCIGTAADLNTFYSYNCDEKDGGPYSPAWNRIPDGNLPVQATTFLNHSLDRTRFFYASGTAHFASHFMEPPHRREGFYHALNGNWTDGVPLTFGGNGYQANGGTPTSFVFPDNPNDPTGWSMLENIRSHADYRAMMSHYVGEFLPDSIFQLDQAWSIHRGETGNHLSNVNLMYEQIPEIQAWYDADFINIPCLVSDVQDVDNHKVINIFPNPTTGSIQINLNDLDMDNLRIFNSQGTVILTTNQTEIDLSSQPAGVYFIIIEIENGEFLQRKIINL